MTADMQTAYAALGHRMSVAREGATSQGSRKAPLGSFKQRWDGRRLNDEGGSPALLDLQRIDDATRCSRR